MVLALGSDEEDRRGGEGQKRDDMRVEKEM